MPGKVVSWWWDEPTVNSLFEFGVLTEQNCKRILIREEYAERTDIPQKQILKSYLADKYCVSLSTVEKYLATKNNGDPVCSSEKASVKNL
jgi:hypothetical protein